MANCVGIVAQVMNRELLWPLASLLILKQGIQLIFQKTGVQVKKYWMSRKYNVNGLDISIRADLFKEDVSLVWRSSQLNTSKRLPC